MDSLAPTPNIAYTGLRFGNYRLIKCIGKGNFASIYLGKHTYLDTCAAVKILSRRLEKIEVQRFLREARISARLVHPHIIRVLDCDFADELPFIVMDYAPYGSLQRSLQPGTAWKPEVVLTYIWPVAMALQYIHDCKLIHCDVKPGNVLLGPGRQVLLSDFGVAVSMRQAATGPVERIGTVAYMAPEQIDGAPCPATDQYALAVMTYEWLCGQLPFQGSIREIARQHLERPVPPLRQRAPWLSTAVEDVVLRALAKDPSERFSSVSEFALELETATEQDDRIFPETDHARLQTQRSARKRGRLKRSYDFAPGRKDDEDSNADLLLEKEVRRMPLWKKIALLLSTGMALELIVCVVLAVLNVDLHSLWSLLASWILALPPIIWLAREHKQMCLLSSIILFVSMFMGMLAHSPWLLFTLYGILQAGSLVGILYLRDKVANSPVEG